MITDHGFWMHDTFGLRAFFRGVFFHSRVTGACHVTTVLIMRTNVRRETTGDGTLSSPFGDKLLINWGFPVYGGITHSGIFPFFRERQEHCERRVDSRSRAYV